MLLGWGTPDGRQTRGGTGGAVVVAETWRQIGGRGAGYEDVGCSGGCGWCGTAAVAGVTPGARGGETAVPGEDGGGTAQGGASMSGDACGPRGMRGDP